MNKNLIKIFVLIVLTGTAIYLWINRTIEERAIKQSEATYLPHSNPSSPSPDMAPAAPPNDIHLAVIQKLEKLQHDRATIGGANSLDAKKQTAALVSEVAGFKDPRALNALLESLDEVGSASTGLVDLGQVGLDALIEKTKEGDPRRIYAYWALSGFLDKEHLAESLADSGIKNKLLILFENCKEDPNNLVRPVCVQSLAKLNTHD